MQNSGEISPKIPHFFKIILDETLGQGKLRIPKRYIKKYGNALLTSNKVLLRLPDGREWRVGLLKSGGTIWLQNGWQEFARFYCLNHGSFLVFRYDGSCRFEVVILDLSATEIDYPCPSNAREGRRRTNRGSQEQAEDVAAAAAADDDDDDVSVQIIGEASHPKETNGTSSNVENSMEDNAGHRKRVRYTRQERANALGRAKDFKSNKPFFKVLMYATHIVRYNSTRLWIPKDFARTHTSMKAGDACLHVASGRSWRVKYGGLRGNRSSFFHYGWEQFVRDNLLQVGDVCVFELVNTSELTFEVTIYRV